MGRVFKSQKAKASLLSSYDELLGRWPVRISVGNVEGPWGSTHFIEAGDPSLPPLLLFHGVGDNSAVMWIFNIAELSARFRCFAIDSIGGPGKSEPNARFWKDFDYLEWIASVVVGLKLDSCFVAGVSNGAVLAYEALACGVPGVEKAVCIEGGPIVGSQLLAMARFLVILFPEILFPTDENLKKIIGKLASPESGFAEKHPEIVDHVILAMKSHDQRAMSAYRYRRYDADLDRPSRGKMLFIAGDLRRSEKGLFSEVLIPGGYRTAIVENAGHGVNQEQPEAVNRLIIDFLEEVGADGATLL